MALYETNRELYQAINGLIRLKERRQAAQEIAKKLKNYEESGAKKQIEPDNQEWMNCL